jgi:hypothetical protein
MWIVSDDIKVESFSFRRFLVTLWVLAGAAFVAGLFVPFLGGIGWYLVAIFMFAVLNLLWDAWFDWRDLRRKAFIFADYTATLTTPDAKYYSVLAQPRDFPPKLMWVYVVNDHSSRIYMGWNFWVREEPEYEKAVTRGIRRKQVA